MSKKKLSVLILVENLPVPFDRRVWMEATSLLEDGFDVSVIAINGGNQKKQDQIDGINIFRYPPPRPTQRKIDYILEFVYCWLATFYLTWKVLFKKGFDVIHACNPPDSFFLIGIIYKFLGKKFVYDQHDLCPEIFTAKFPEKEGGWTHRALLFLEKMSYRTADAVIVPNSCYQEIAIERGKLKPSTVCIVRSAPDSKFFKRKPARQDLKRWKRWLVGYVGIMGKQDGVEHLLRAAWYTTKELKRTEVGFLLIGDGDEFAKLKELARKLEIEEHVIFVGRVSDERKVVEYLSSCEVGISPDPKCPFNDNSTMNKVVEYMALELPIVSYDLKETRLTAGEAGIYASPNDYRDLALKTLMLLDDPHRRAEMGKYARKRFDGKLQWKYSRENLLRLYNTAF